MSPDRVVVPEPPTGLGDGFLTEYWRSQEPLPTLEGPHLWWYYVQRGFQTMLALPMSNAIAVMTIAISLFMLGGFLLLLQNVDRVISRAGSSLYVTAYVREGTPEPQVAELLRELEGNSRVRSVQLVTKQQALESFRKQLGPSSDVLEGLAGENPLPASLDLVLYPDELGTGSIEAVVSGLRKKPIIDDVAFGSEWVDRAQNILKVFRLFGVVGLLIALAVIVFLIANTIKLVIYARRDEIGIMQLVGASDGFVKIPFVISGLVQGGIGAVIGVILLWGGFFLLDLQVRNSQLFGVTLPELSFLGIGATIIVLLLGLIVGALGSFFALGRFMKS